MVNTSQPIRYFIYALAALAILGAWKLQGIHELHLLEGRESDPNPRQGGKARQPSPIAI